MGEELVGMDAVVSELTTSLSAANLWAVFADIIPFVAVVTLVALGFYLIRRQLKKVSKMKGGV